MLSSDENLGYETPNDVYNGKADGQEFVYVIICWMYGALTYGQRFYK